MVPELITQYAQTGVLHSQINIQQTNPNTFINSYFENIYVITTTNNIERQLSIKARLLALGINYTLCVMNVPTKELYSVYDSWYDEFILPQETAVNRKPINFAKLSIGELGCCASHIFVLNSISTKQSIKKSLVLEDDALFIDRFETRFKNAVAKNIDCDFLALGCNDYNIKSRNIITEETYKDNKDSKQYLYCPNPEQGIWYGMHAYSLVPKAAKQFISYINTFVRPCDHYLWLMFVTAKPGQSLTIWPPLVIQDRTTSSLRDITNEQNTQTYYFQKCLPGLDKDMYGIQQQSDKTDPITVVLTYFNPACYKSRKANLEYMLVKLLNSPVNEIVLVTIKNSEPQLLLPLDSRIKLVQIETTSILFHKESLQNKGWKVANKMNPYILFLDTDIVFDKPWTKQLMAELDKKDIVQAWHKATLLDRYGNPEKQEQSWASIATQKPNAQMVTSFKAHTGFAWAFRRDFLESIEDLNIHCVIGSGDQILARALLNTEIQSRHNYMKQSYENFTKRIQQNLTRGFGYLDGIIITHLYHGDLANRKYYERHLYLADINFNISELIVTDDIVEFKNPEKWNHHFSKYFAERNEDDGFYTYCMVKKGDSINCAKPVKKSDVLIEIQNNSETAYTTLLQIAESHPESTLLIYEQTESGILSDNIARIDLQTKTQIQSHVLYKFIL